MKNKFIPITFFIVFMLISYTSCKNTNVIKIGVFEPITGDNKVGGKQETLGIQYANYLTPTVKIGNKEFTVQLEIIDNESSQDKAITTASELINKGVSVVLGSYDSEVSLTASDTFANAGIPVIAISCKNPKITQDNNHYFRMCYLDPFQGTVLANFAKNNFTAKTAYCLAKLGDDYSVSLCNSFIAAFKKLGGNIVFDTFPNGVSNFKDYLVDAKNQKADIFFSPVSIESAKDIIKQASVMDFSIPILASDAWDSDDVLKLTKGTNLQIYLTTFFVEGSTNQNALDFVNRFQDFLNTDFTTPIYDNGEKEISAISAMGFDAYYTVLEALKLSGSINSVELLNALPAIKYEGVTGLLEFDEIGNAKRDALYIKKVDNSGKWQFITIQQVKK